MSAVELAIEKVKALDETQARLLIHWLQTQAPKSSPARPPAGARAMLGFARRSGRPARTTANWMAELREGEKS